MNPISLDMTRVESRTHLLDQKVEGDHTPNEMPPHWVFKRDKDTSKIFPPHLHSLVYGLHKVLCVFGFGHSNLRDVWEMTHPKCRVEVVDRTKDKLRQRLEHVNIVVCYQYFDRWVLIFTEMSRIGWFALYCDGRFLYHGSS